MTVFGISMTLSLIALSLALSVVPVWFAAKVVGAERPEFLRVALALVLATAISAVAIKFLGGWGFFAAPIVFVLMFSHMLHTSYLGALVMCILALAFQTMVSKLFQSGSVPG